MNYISRIARQIKGWYKSQQLTMSKKIKRKFIHANGVITIKKPDCIHIDEQHSLYKDRISDLIATAQSNKVVVLLGFCELPKCHNFYGKEIEDTIFNISANTFGLSEDQEHQNLNKKHIENTISRIKGHSVAGRSSFSPDSLTAQDKNAN